jgi:hypothetical protein
MSSVSSLRCFVLFVCFFLEARFHQVAHAGLELVVFYLKLLNTGIIAVLHRPGYFEIFFGGTGI